MQTLEPSRVAGRVRNLLSHHPASP
jgi:hypothetical protein